MVVLLLNYLICSWYISFISMPICLVYLFAAMFTRKKEGSHFVLYFVCTRLKKVLKRWICNWLLLQWSEVIWGSPPLWSIWAFKVAPRHFYKQGTLCWGMCWSIRPHSEDNNMSDTVTQTLRAHLVVFFTQNYMNNVAWKAILLCGKHFLNIEYCFEGLVHLKRSLHITVGWGYTMHTKGIHNRVFFANTHI